MEPANIAELRRTFDVAKGSYYVPMATIQAILARSERLERAVDLLRIHADPGWNAVAALLAEHDAVTNNAKEQP